MKHTRPWGRGLRLAVLLTLILGTLTLSALAVEWDLADGTLTVTGEGDVPDYFAEEELADHIDEIRHIVLSEGITELGYESFYGCTGLTELTLPETLEYIGDGCFAECPGLTRIKFPASVTDIGDSEFLCDEGGSLTSITFHGAPYYISDYAFEGVTATALYYEDSGWEEAMLWGYEGELTWLPIVTSGTCGSNATWTLAGTTLIISGTGAMADYDQAETPWAEYKDSITQVIVEEGITGIGNWAFYEMNALNQVTLPDSLVFIGLEAFSFCTNLTEITLPSNLVTIYPCAFQYSGLTSIVIPASVTSLGNSLFYYCENLKSCTLPSNLEVIPNQFFSFCANLESIHIPASVKRIDSEVFYGCTALRDIYIDDLEKWCNIDNQADFSAEYVLHLNGEPVIDLVIPDSVAFISGFFS